MYKDLVNLHYGLESEQEYIKKFKTLKYFAERFYLLKKLKAHKGCVNTISWSSDGQYLISGSDDLTLVISDANTLQPLYTFKTDHLSNIFCVKFFPDQNNKIVSCAGDGNIIITNITQYLPSLGSPYAANLTEYTDIDQQTLSCHNGTVYKVLPLPQEVESFISCGEDGTVRYFDLKHGHTCSTYSCKNTVLIDCGQPISCVCIDPLHPYIIICGCLDGSVRFFDQRKLPNTIQNNFDESLEGMYGYFLPENLKGDHRITSLVCDPYSKEVLASYSGENIYLINTQDFYHGDNQFIYKDNKDETGKSEEELSRCTKSKKDGPLKSFHIRLRGDWSDTGPLATSDISRSTDNAVILAPPSTSTTQEIKVSPNPTENASNYASSSNNNDSNNNNDNNNISNNNPTRRLGDVLVNQMTSMLNTYLACKRNRIQNVANSLNISANALADTNNRKSLTNTYLLDCQPSVSNNNILDFCLPTNEIDNTLLEPLFVNVPKEPVYQQSAETPMSSRNSPSSNHISNASLSTRSSEQPNGQQMDTEEETIDTYQDTTTHRYSMHKKKISLGELFKRMNQNNLTVGDNNSHENDNRTNRCKRFKTQQIYKGHRNSRTMIKECNFWGDAYVISGSDCGHIFIWDRMTGQIVNVIEADKHVVNCVQPHPHRLIIASSGIDYDIKFWGIRPTDNPADDYSNSTTESPSCKSVNLSEKIAEIVKRNEIMRAETRDIVTIPASFMIRMLAHMRRQITTNNNINNDENNELESNNDSTNENNRLSE